MSERGVFSSLFTSVKSLEALFSVVPNTLSTKHIHKMPRVQKPLCGGGAKKEVNKT
jgi:hypothetical protein